MGLESCQKKLSLKRILLVQNPDIILLQETMGTGAAVTTLLNSVVRNFYFLAHNEKGHSGGLTIGWNLSSVKCINSWNLSFGMGIQFF